MSLPLSAIPKCTASYSTTLAADITSGATSLSVVTATDDAGNALSGVVGLTIAGEFIIGTKSGANVTGCLRGVDPQDGTTERVTLQAAHVRGTPVVITDAPFLAIAYRLLNGDEGFPNKLKYASAPTLTADADICTKVYADGIALAGAPDAAVGTKGVTKLTTAPSSPTEPIAVGATDVATTGASKVLRLKSDGLIDDANLALTAAGDMVYSDGTDLKKLAKGTTGLFLEAGASAPTWGGSNLAEANTFFGSTDITGAEAESLTDGTVLTAKHYHKKTSGAVAGNGASTQNIAHGLGVVPKQIAISAFGTYNAAATASRGTYDGTNMACAAEGTATSVTVIYCNNAGTARSATVTMDATNIILAWSSATNGSITMLWEAEV